MKPVSARTGLNVCCRNTCSALLPFEATAKSGRPSPSESPAASPTAPALVAMKSGLDVEQVVEALGGGAAQSWVLANRSGRMIANDYPLGFKTSLHRKDLGIALALAAEVGATLPVAALCAQLETGLVTQGHGDDDMSAVARTIRELSGLEA